MANRYTAALLSLVFVSIVVNGNPGDGQNPEADVGRLRTAIDPIDKEQIIDIVTHRTSDELLKISELYKKIHGDDLIETLSRVLTGNLKNIIVALITPLYDYYAQELEYALSVGIPDEGTLVEILTTIEYWKVEEIEAAYERIWRRTLQSDCKTDPYDLYDIIDDIINPQTAVAENFQKLIDGRRRDDLLVIYEMYAIIALTSKGGVNVDVVRDFGFEQNEYFARKLYNSLARKDERTLIRILVTRCENDLHNITEKFEKAHYGSITSRIKNEPDDDYRKAKLSLVTSKRCARGRRTLE